VEFVPYHRDHVGIPILVQMFSVKDSLGASVIDMKANELLRGSPVVMPGEHPGFVAKRASGAEPAVAEIVVFGRMPKSSALVEPADVGHGLSIQAHVVRPQDPGGDKACEILGLG
jgi:hypothetical protein